MREPDRDAEFGAFVTEHRPMLVRAARLLTAGDDAGAEDVVQQTLTRMYVHWQRVRRADSPVGYARQSLTHTFLDETRRAHRRREWVSADPGDDAGSDSSHQPDIELRHAVLGALRGLPPRQRAVVVLRHWLDLDVAETAVVLDCSTGTVKSQNAKALAHLRQTLDLTTTLETR
ncbi:MAG: putative polymerase ECF-subfamily sigma factor [Nocardioidaceae bacterium]|nr:putative polymerase ECF-subfamily sigma factor [Nocardioidaceae bacterium]